MIEALLVHVAYSRRDLDQAVRDVFPGACLCGGPLCQILSLDVLLNDVNQVAFLLDFIHGDEGRMFELGGRACFVQEALALLAGRQQLATRDLQRHQTIESRIVREVDHSKTTLTQAASNQEPADLLGRG